ncbi:MAG: 4-hydroxybenzoate octaprenyltransferase [Alphaproteobacteria bacterium]|nr:4-hydroxybenzoate octaprenyltransferase [Alphaproteobacteria bacterium]
MSVTDDVRPADAAPSTWVDTYAPAALRPYLRLARADRPIGVWLLLWPCWWSILLGAGQSGFGFGLIAYVAWMMLLFALGAAVMRGAGCTYNDIVDRDIDAKVARTAGRPIPSGQVSVAMAFAFLAAQLVIGLLVLWQLNWLSVVLGALSLVPIAIYPFMKRITDWPQAFLGLTFNWGALLGWSAVTGGLGVAPVLLFGGCIFWTLGYDTIYAHQDKEDDALIGVRSTARLFGERTKPWLAAFYGAAWSLWLSAGLVAGLGVGFFVGLGLVAAQLTWQVLHVDINDGANCLATFKSNRDLGLVMLGAILAGIITG